MVHKVKSANEFMKSAEGHIFAAGQHVVVKLSQDAIAQIQKRSLGQLTPEVKRTVRHFVVGVKPTPEDPTGARAQEVERSTQAFSKTQQQLSDKTYVQNLLQGKR
jgi:hypothetical protein